MSNWPPAFSGLRSTCLKLLTCPVGYQKNGKWRKQTWWWGTAVIMQWKKKGDWKIWKNGGSKKNYVLTKKVAKQRVFAENKTHEKEKLKDVETDTNIIYCIAKQMKQEKYWGKYLFGMITVF